MIAASIVVKRLVSLVTVALLLTLSSAAYANPQPASQDIVDTAVSAGSFKTLVAAGKVTAAQAMKLNSAKTVNGQSLAISTDGGMVKINDATVTKADIMCSNGVIHVIDTVLMPK